MEKSILAKKISKGEELEMLRKLQRTTKCKSR